MKYSQIAEAGLFFDFVFYEVEDKTMYVYCPNCGCEHEIDLRHTTVAQVKKTYPCSCFSDRIDLCSAAYYMPSYPHFYRTSARLADLNRSKYVAEFAKCGDNVCINVYNVSASFDADNYDYEGGTCFKRYPVFDWDLVSTITFEKSGNVTIQTRLMKYMGCYAYSTKSEMRTTKNWALAMADAAVIRESTAELAGTFLEQWANELDNINEAYSTKTNLSSWDSVWDAFTVAVLIDLHQNVAYRKMWKAGFTSLCINHTMRLPTVRYNDNYVYNNLGHATDKAILNWRAKTLDKIFKIDIPQIDKVLERNKAEVDAILAIKRMLDLNVPITKANYDIMTDMRMDELEKLCVEHSVSIPAVVKYMRKHTARPSDYYDYLHCTILLNVPLTKDVLFPKHFKEAHDRQTGLYNDEQSAVTRSAFTKAIQQYISANYKDDRYQIRVIRTVDQLKRWGAKMHNCSGGYVERVLNKQSVIFVLTETAHPQRAFCMLEYSPDKHALVQVRGVHNCECGLNVSNWATLWQHTILEPLLLKKENLKNNKGGKHHEQQLACAV